MGKITYTRGTSYAITHNYTAPQYLGATLIFTVKNVPNDDDATDTTNQIMAPKRVSMTGSSFPQSTIIQINPGDVPMTIDGGEYYYSVKVIDVNAKEYIADSGTFTLNVSTTNEIT